MDTKNRKRRRTSDLLTTSAFILAFIIMLGGLFIPIALVESSQNRLFASEGKKKSGEILPMNPSNETGMELQISENADTYSDIYSRLKLFQLSDDKREREAFSYELTEEKTLEYAKLCINTLLGSYAERYIETAVASGYSISSNYLAISSEQEIEMKHKNVEVGGLSLPYDLGIWSFDVLCDGLQFKIEMDSISGRVYSLKLSAEKDFPLSCDNMLVSFAKYHGILDTERDIKYDTDALKIDCDEIEFFANKESNAGGINMSFDIRLIEKASS